MTTGTALATRTSFGVNLQNWAGPGADPVAFARLAESMGFDLLTVHPDHPPANGAHGSGSYYETWTLLTWIAAHTASIALAPCVLSVPYRHPAVAAKMAETLQRLSGGRLVLPVGAGGDDDAHDAFGLAHLSPPEKVEATAEAIDVMRGLWRESSFSYDGRHFSTHAASIEPRPDVDIPVWIGGFGPRMVQLAANKADGWLPSWFRLRPDVAAQRLSQLRRAAADAGREPAGIVYGYNVPVIVDASVNRPDMVSGSVDSVAEQLAGLVDKGFTLLNLWPVGDPRQQLELLAASVVPQVRDRTE